MCPGFDPQQAHSPARAAESRSPNPWLPISYSLRTHRVGNSPIGNIDLDSLMRQGPGSPGDQLAGRPALPGKYRFPWESCVPASNPCLAPITGSYSVCLTHPATRGQPYAVIASRADIIKPRIGAPEIPLPVAATYRRNYRPALRMRLR